MVAGLFAIPICIDVQQASFFEIWGLYFISRFATFVGILEQYKIASSDLAEITGEQDFISGYQLGVKMIMAGIGRSEEG